MVMVDANQKWGVDQAIKWMEELAPFKLHWIEEPTSPDDVMGHKKISDALKKYGTYFYCYMRYRLSIILNRKSRVHIYM